MTEKASLSLAAHKNTTASIVRKDLKRNWKLYLLALPVVLYYIIFHYKPMYGLVIAFKSFVPRMGIMGSEWVGFKHFIDFFSSGYLYRIFCNTMIISFSNLLFAFPAPIILALLVNEMKGKHFPRVVKTVSYLPHFISLVVICGMVKDFTMDKGVINDVIAFFGGTRVSMLNQPRLFVPIYVISDIWQTIGWNSIIYLAALSGIDQSLYEAASIDGAGRVRQMWNVTLPGIIPTIVIMLILRVGNMMNVGYEKIILLYNSSIYETADVISTYVYRKGLLEFNYSYSAAVGLMNSVINFLLLIFANKLSNRLSGGGLW